MAVQVPSNINLFRKDFRRDEIVWIGMATTTTTTQEIQPLQVMCEVLENMQQRIDKLEWQMQTVLDKINRHRTNYS